MKELKFEELTTRQKLGMTFTALLHRAYRPDYEWVYDMIRQRSLGAVWIQEGIENSEEYMRKVKEIADYPILIITDAESGIGQYKVGRHNAIGCTGSEKHAYAFGKTVGVTARKMGYNVVCDPVLDMIDGHQRSLGTDKYKVAALAAAEAQGLHDGGVLTVGKHYPTGSDLYDIDSHMAERLSTDTAQELLDYYLYPYTQLMEKGLLDGLMSQHKRFLNIDPEHPATLSKPVLDIIRQQGFDGFFITDGLTMMGIRAKYDDVTSKGLAISAGIDLLLPFEWNNPEQFGQYCEAYEKGLIPEDTLNTAVKRILAAQYKVMCLPQDTELTQEDIETFHNINKDSIYTQLDPGIPATISRDGKHFFALMVDQETDIATGGQPEVDTFSHGWLYPERVIRKIRELFPNSAVRMIHQFPSPGEIRDLLNASLGYDEFVFMTFTEPLGYTGEDRLTHRIVKLFQAMQLTNRISTVIHVGNPHMLEALPHIPRCIFGGLSAEGVDACFEVLAGEYPAKGVPTYEFTLQ